MTDAHGYMVRYLLSETAGEGDEVKSYRDMMSKRFSQELDAAVSTAAYDPNQTGATKTGAVSVQGRRLVRTS